MQGVLGFVAGFCGLELFSFLLHKYLFHGVLWPVHRDHHGPRQRGLERNDSFSLAFTLLAVGLLELSQRPGAGHAALLLGAGLGISAYAAVYFVLHDLLTHRRFFKLPLPGPGLGRRLTESHRRHHQRSDKPGQGPWGLRSGW